MLQQEFTFGNYPFPPDKKRPIHIKGELIKNFIYPAEVPHYSDLNQLFVSTDKLTVGTWQLGPGGTYNPPDLHAGDEVYYIVEGTLTEHNPVLGEFINIDKGEALLLPMGGYHKGYNFGQGIMKVLYIIAPKIWLDQEPPMDFAGENMKMYKGKYNSRLKNYPQMQQWNVHGTTDDIGRWPVPGPQCRKEPVLFYHITEEKKLLNVYGAEFPVLIKFFVSNDLCHMGEFILPAGGVGCRASEPDSHRGDCCLNIEIGPITIFLPDTLQAYDVQPGEAFFIPEGIKYQMINYTDHMVKAIFSIAPGM
ncbi:MAG: cupin domain-containing protein [Actinobacteria bacterium]|nr:cupin domain-containing protein [Actinomycetota bacterium]